MARNARAMGRAYAEYGLSLEDLARDLGVDDVFVFTFTREGAREVATIAWEMTRVWWGFEDGGTVVRSDRAWINVARFARAANEYARTPFACARVVNLDDRRDRVVQRIEDDGSAESGPSVSVWFEVEGSEYVA